MSITFAAARAGLLALLAASSPTPAAAVIVAVGDQLRLDFSLSQPAEALGFELTYTLLAPLSLFGEDVNLFVGGQFAASGTVSFKTNGARTVFGRSPAYPATNGYFIALPLDTSFDLTSAVALVGTSLDGPLTSLPVTITVIPPVVTPLPAALPLLAVSLAGLAARARRRS